MSTVRNEHKDISNGMIVKVLIVEDDEWLAQGFERVLKSAGYKVLVSGNAHAAVDVIDDFAPDVLVLDIMLPSSNGFTLLNELQTHSDTKDLPVVVCSNLAGEFKAKDLEPYGVKRLVDKTSMEPADIVAAVRSVLP